MAQILVYADEELKKAVEQAAASEERSISYLVRKWIKEGLQRRMAEAKSKTEEKSH